jgi:hypothetical protein
MDTQILNALHPGQRIERVELSGIGGSVEAAQRAAAALKLRGATTAVAVGDCASACATMFEEFPHRYVTPNARLGFHAFWGGSFNSAERAQQVEIERLVSRGVAYDYANHLFASRDLTWPSLDSLQGHHLANGCWDTTSAAPADCNQGLSSR